MVNNAIWRVFQGHLPSAKLWPASAKDVYSVLKV